MMLTVIMLTLIIARGRVSIVLGVSSSSSSSDSSRLLVVVVLLLIAY